LLLQSKELILDTQHLFVLGEHLLKGIHKDIRKEDIN